MESKKIYEASHKELVRIREELSKDNILSMYIDMRQLDQESFGEIKQCILQCTNKIGTCIDGKLVTRDGQVKIMSKLLLNPEIKQQLKEVVMERIRKVEPVIMGLK